MERLSGVSLHENEKSTIRWRLGRLSLEVAKKKVGRHLSRGTTTARLPLPVISRITP